MSDTDLDEKGLEAATEAYFREGFKNTPTEAMRAAIRAYKAATEEVGPVAWRYRWPVPYGSGEWRFSEERPKHVANSTVAEVAPLYAAPQPSQSRHEAKDMWRIAQALGVGPDEVYSVGTLRDRIAALSASPQSRDAAAMARLRAFLAEPDNLSTEDEIPVQSGAHFGEITFGDLRAIAASPQREGWRDISTAPKDGTRVLVLSWAWGSPDLGEYIENIAHWDGKDWSTAYPGDLVLDENHIYPPTLWQPLPTPPKEG